MPVKLAVEIEGLKELQASLRAVDDGLPRELSKVNKYVAMIVAEKVQQRVPVRSGAARRSVRPAAQQRYAVIRAGGKVASYYPFLDFGGRVGRNRSVSRPFRRAGRYIWPTVADENARIIDAYVEQIDDLLDKAEL